MVYNNLEAADCQGRLPRWCSGKEPTCSAQVAGDTGSIPEMGRSPWRRDRLRSPVFLGFSGGSDSKESTCDVGDLGSIPGLGRSPGEGNGNPLQYSCLENPIDRKTWWTTVHGLAKSGAQLSD